MSGGEGVDAMCVCVFMCGCLGRGVGGWVSGNWGEGEDAMCVCVCVCVCSETPKRAIFYHWISVFQSTSCPICRQNLERVRATSV